MTITDPVMPGPQPGPMQPAPGVYRPDQMAAVQPTPTAGVRCELNRYDGELGELIDRLDSSIAMLQDRLAAVLRPTSPSAGGPGIVGAIPRPPTYSAAADELASLNDRTANRIGSLTDTVNGITARIDL